MTPTKVDGLLLQHRMTLDKQRDDADERESES